MPRHPLTIDFRDDAGNSLVDVLLEIRRRDLTDAGATLDDAGTTPAPPQINDDDADGLITVWLEPGQYEWRGVRGAEASDWLPSDIGEIDGPVGPVGPPGPIGPQGDVGPQGVQGDVGPQGVQGDVGPQGPAGVDGADGPIGPQGDPGPQGVQGDVGPEGPAGVDGADGPPGPQGDLGPQGALGPQGDVGPAGAQGPAGADGADGAPGPQGDVGPQGPQGLQGDPGARGSKWFSGGGAPDSFMAGTAVGDWYLDYFDGNVYEKTAAAVWTQRDNFHWINHRGDWVSGTAYVQSDGVRYQGAYYRASRAIAQAQRTLSPAAYPGGWQLIVPKGDTGDTGATGATGEVGAAGPPGVAGPQGDPGPQGPAGAEGVAGADGATGFDTAPIGSIISTTRSTWSDEYVLADGSMYTETLYPDAYAAAVAEQSAGNPLWMTILGDTGIPNKFVVPDLRDRFLYGRGAKTLGTKGGEETHTLTFPEAGVIRANGSDPTDFPSKKLNAYPNPDTGDLGAVPHNNMPPFAVLVFLVKVKGVAASADVIQGPTGPPGPAGPAGLGAAGTNIAMCSVYRNATMSNFMPHNAYSAVVPFDVEEYDPENIYNPANGRFTPKESGRYMFNCGIASPGSGTTFGTWQAWLFKNGVEERPLGADVINTVGQSTQVVNLDGGVVVEANGTTDYFEIKTWQTSGAAKDLRGGRLSTFAQMTKVDRVGPPGPAGEGAHWAGAWAAATAYAFNDIATYNNQSYRRKVAGTTATAPLNDTANWELVAGVPNITLDAVHVVGSAGEPAFENGWLQYDANHPVHFRKDPLGKVTISGLAKSGIVAQNIFTLPVGYRPSTDDVAFAANANGVFGVLLVNRNGQVRLQSGSNAYAYLDGIEFDTESVTQTVNATAQPMEAFHQPGQPGEPPFQNGAAAYPGYTLRFRKDPFGKVKLSGVIKPSAGAGDHVMFTLPAGYRPVGNDRSFLCLGSNANVTCYVTTDGAVHAPMGQAFIYLDSVEFDTETVTNYSAGLIGAPFVTAFPANPFDGQECYLCTADMDTNGCVWHMRYRTGKGWEFVGGDEYRIKALTGYTCAAASTWEIVGTGVAPRWTCPRAGSYRFKYGCRFQTSGSTAVEGYMGLSINGAIAFDSIRRNTLAGASSSIDIAYLSYETQVTLNAGDVLAITHNTQNFATLMSYSGQWFDVKPLRLP